MKMEVSDKVATPQKRPHIKKGFYHARLAEVKPKKNEGKYGKKIVLLFGILNDAYKKDASASQRLILTQQKSIKNISQNTRTLEMQQRSIQKTYQTLICSVQDFLAKHSQLLEKGKVSKIQEAHCFLKLKEFLKAKNLLIYSSKMSKAYSVTQRGKLSLTSFKGWMNWGIVLNGCFLTARISKFPKIENECTFLDIIERRPKDKYYLTDQTLKYLIKRIRKGWNSNMMEIIKAKESILYQELLQQYPQVKQEEIIFRLFQKYIRRLTPLETERLQGFPDNWTEGVSETQRYSQCGNAVTVNVIYEVLDKMY